MAKMATAKEIAVEIEQFGECFIGTVEVQGTKVFARYKRVQKEFEKMYPNAILAYDAHTGICWWA